MRTSWLILIAFVASHLVCDELKAQTQETPKGAPSISNNPHDWPMYNRDVAGTRYNPAESQLNKDNVNGLVELWRFPLKDSVERISFVYTTVVVDGCTYFGSGRPPVEDPRMQPSTFFKLTPEGKVAWSFALPERTLPENFPVGHLPRGGFVNAALVTDDTVYVGEASGRIFALNRETGTLRWEIDTRDKAFKGAHPSNCVMSSPILANGLVIIGGGGFEHWVGNLERFPEDACSGRGFVVALDPRSGEVVWKYEVGPEPKELDPPVTIVDDFGRSHTYHYGPSTSSVWSTPSYDPTTNTVYFGTDCHNSPRQPTEDNPKLHTKHSCAVIAVDASTGKERWVTQFNPGDVWNYGLRAYDAKTKTYKDLSVGDTPKPYWIAWNKEKRRVVGVGCKNGVFYVLDAKTGEVLTHTPAYTGPPVRPPKNVNPRTLALPSAIGGLQTGCATDGKSIFTNGMDILGRWAVKEKNGIIPPTGGRVVSLSLDTRHENWRHERLKVGAVGGTKDKPAFTDIGDSVASGIAVANGVAYFTTAVSNKLVAIDIVDGRSLKEIYLGPVWCGPVVSRGRVYVGTGNQLFDAQDRNEDFFPKSPVGSVRCFGLPSKSGADSINGR